MCGRVFARQTNMCAALQHSVFVERVFFFPLLSFCSSDKCCLLRVYLDLVHSLFILFNVFLKCKYCVLNKVSSNSNFSLKSN